MSSNHQFKSNNANNDFYWYINKYTMIAYTIDAYIVNAYTNNAYINNI